MRKELKGDRGLSREGGGDQEQECESQAGTCFRRLVSPVGGPRESPHPEQGSHKP